MALIKCYECEKEISDKAAACPHCGAPKEEQPPQIEEAEIPESLAVVDEPEPITQETVSAPSTEPEPVATMELALVRSRTAAEWIERLGRWVSERGQGEYDNYTALAVLVHEATDADVDTIEPAAEPRSTITEEFLR